jgi:hypothetical protein
MTKRLTDNSHVLFNSPTPSKVEALHKLRQSGLYVSSGIVIDPG